MSTIIALATPPCKSAIHIIRISGPRAFEIINKLSKTPVSKTTDRVEINFIISSQFQKPIDQVVLIKFYGPHSYTGEDLIEINCHGSILISSLIIQEAISLGCTLAQPGEFTKRALLNNKINLNEVENIHSLFNTKSTSELVGYSQELLSNNSKTLKEAEQALFALIGSIELSIDYPPDISSLEQDEHFKFTQEIIKIKTSLEILQSNSKAKKPSSFRVLLLGQPNVGKSSLLNYLLQEDKIIVSNIPGTTRDVIEIEYFYNNYLITLVDSAGIRQSNDFLEQESIKRTKHEIEKANLIIFLISSSDLEEPESKRLNQEIKDLLLNKENIVVYTKGDLCADKSFRPLISVKNKDLNDLYSILDSKLSSDYLPTGLKSEYLISQLNGSIESLELSLEDGLSIDLMSERLSMARNYLLNSLAMTEQNFEFINKLFDNFCVGK